MQIQQNISLKPYNTFGIDVPAEYFVSINEAGELEEAGGLNRNKHALGGGSNILLTKPVTGLVILNCLKGINIIKEDADSVWLKVNSGEVWHELVLYAIKNGWAGLENLALIPGSVGAAPIQNIGAYGIEVKETIQLVEAWNWNDEAFVTYNNTECQFGYRDSIFKHGLKDKIFITSVTFKLHKTPQYNTAYGAVEQELQRMGVRDLSIKAIADAVIHIRTSKLPDPKQIGNAGSFFKNPTIPKDQFQLLQHAFPSMPSYTAHNGVKIPAAWLIEQCGWKGYRKGDAGVHEKQALVLVNYGHVNGDEIWQLSEEILRSVNQKFGITLEREVQVW
jgi:UDP-N-acetylmuramate dehydrogenase